MKSNLKILAAWGFDGTQDSIATALKKYPALRFTDKGDAGGVLSLGQLRVVPGRWLCLMEDGSFQSRRERSVRRAGFVSEELEEDDALEDELNTPSAERGRPVAAWFFDGSEQSVSSLVAGDPDMHFVPHPDGNYLVWDEPLGTRLKPRSWRRRFQPGRFIVRTVDGKYSRRKTRGVRKAGLVD